MMPGNRVQTWTQKPALLSTPANLSSVTKKRRFPSSTSDRTIVIDIGKFYAETGMFTYDPGYIHGAESRSPISTAMRHPSLSRPPVRQLAEHGDFKTCAFCFMVSFHGEAFDNRVTRHTMVHEQMSRFIRDSARCSRWRYDRLRWRAFRRSTIPTVFDPMQRMIASIRMIAKMQNGRHGL
jgi:citrate synthase